MKVLGFFMLIGLLWPAVACFGQTRSLIGTAKDTVNGLSLSNQTVYLLNAADSGIVAFTRIKKDGSFRFAGVDTGTFILKITAQGYADYMHAITIVIGSPDSLNVGAVYVYPRIDELKSFVLRKKLSLVTMNGDTTEFNVDSIHLQPNATVEDLLKHLPGMEVNQNGSITAQGQPVKKVLVDGNEFFGQDPTLATRNLYATMIDKIQLYDAKSKMATFSGVYDGQTTTTLNLKLKKDSKTGYFGKAEAAYGTDNFYENQAMYNRFDDNQKYAVYGIAANTNRVELNSEDQESYTGSSNLSGNTGLDNWDGKYSGQGIPTVTTAGAHYDSKWDGNKQSVNGNYKFFDVGVTGESNTQSQQNLSGETINSVSTHGFNDKSLRNNVYLTYEMDPAPTSSVTIVLDGSAVDKTLGSSNQSTSTRQGGPLLNSADRTLNSSGNNDNFNGQVTWLQKLNTEGRTLSLDAHINNYKSDYTGFLWSRDEFYDSVGAVDSMELIDEYRIERNRSLILDSRVVYAEPIDQQKMSTIAVDYGIHLDNSNAGRQTFDRSAAGKYDSLDNPNSNTNNVTELTQRGGLSLTYRFRKITFNGGCDLGVLSLNQNNTDAIGALRKNYANWYPNAYVKYEFTKQKMVSLSYEGHANTPSAGQLNPVFINDDPLNVFTGNPGLRPSFGNGLNFLYRAYSMITNMSFIVHGGYSFTENPIVQSIQTDSTGKNIFQSQNAYGRTTSNLNSSFLYSRKFSELGLSASLDGQFDQGIQLSYSNNVVNRTVGSTYQLGLGFSRFISEKYDLSMSFREFYTTNRFSLQPGNAVNYWSSNARFHLEVYPTKRFTIHAECLYTFQQPSTAFTSSLRQYIVNCWVSEKMLPAKNLTVKIAANDLLNQNLGFNRYAMSNFISQSSYTTIGRYFMLSLTWNFKKFGNGKTQKS